MALPSILKPGSWERNCDTSSLPYPRHGPKLNSFCLLGITPLHVLSPSNTISPAAQATITAHLCDRRNLSLTSKPPLLPLLFHVQIGFFQNASLNMSFSDEKLFLASHSAGFLAWPQGPVLPSLCSFSTHIIPPPSCCPAAGICFCNIICSLPPQGLCTYCSLCSPFPSSKMQNHDECDRLKYRLMSVYFNHTTGKLLLLR